MSSAQQIRPPGLLNRVAFWVFWAAFGMLLRLWFRMRIENRPKLEGAYVVAPNHASFLDPVLVGAASTRRITFMMTALLYRSPALNWFYRWNHAVPVATHGSNRDALRAARAILRSGRVLGIFPEGGLSRDTRPMLGNPGAVSLVLSEKVPVVPVGVIGAARAFPYGAILPRPRKVVVRFGEPISAEELAALPGDRKARLNAATRRIMDAIGELVGHPSRAAELEQQRD